MKTHNTYVLYIYRELTRTEINNPYDVIVLRDVTREEAFANLNWYQNEYEYKRGMLNYYELMDMDKNIVFRNFIEEDIKD